MHGWEPPPLTPFRKLARAITAIRAEFGAAAEQPDFRSQASRAVAHSEEAWRVYHERNQTDASRAEEMDALERHEEQQ
eukprot:6572334-Prymnesium_polylepis.1